MAIHIMGYKQAQCFVPDKPTVAMRIFDVDAESNNHLQKSQPLVSSRYWLGVHRFSFRDIDLNHILEFDNDVQRVYYEAYPEILTPQLAGNIMAIPPSYIRPRNTPDFLIHCHQGERRSPAIGIAFAEMYQVDDPQRLRREFPNFNKYVSQTLIHEKKK